MCVIPGRAQVFIGNFASLKLKIVPCLYVNCSRNMLKLLVLETMREITEDDFGHSDTLSLYVCD